MDGPPGQVPASIVRLGAAAPAGTFVDFAPLHLITTSTLDAIGNGIEQYRYRPNIVISTRGPGFTENDWLGRDLRVGRTW